jgi:hypothetical protein
VNEPDYQAAREVRHRAAAGTVSTEDLRDAMIGYRALFGDLPGQAPDAGTSEQFTEPDPKEMAT